MRVLVLVLGLCGVVVSVSVLFLRAVVWTMLVVNEEVSGPLWANLMN